MSESLRDNYEINLLKTCFVKFKKGIITFINSNSIDSLSPDHHLYQQRVMKLGPVITKMMFFYRLSKIENKLNADRKL